MLADDPPPAWTPPMCQQAAGIMQRLNQETGAAFIAIPIPRHGRARHHA
ncbi:MAG: hypothetical protein R2911_14345 [Caldilineaceae bacterium]